MAPEDLSSTTLGSLGTDHPPVLVAALVARDAMDLKAGELGGLAGDPSHAGTFDGVENIPGGFRRSYSNGTMYMRLNGTPFFLNQPVALRYDLRGNVSSFLGFPTADVALDPDDNTSGVARFENGSIYFWADIGAIDIQHVLLRYVGFHCFGETDEISASDEPYFIMGVLPVNVEQRAVPMTKMYEDVDAGDSVADSIEMYRGEPLGVAMAVSLFEHDEGDPEAFKEQMDAAVDKAADGVTGALAEVPVVGPALAFIAQVVFIIGGPELKNKVNEALGTADDNIANENIVLSTKDLVRLSQQPTTVFEGIDADIETPLLSGDGASYKAYFTVEAVAP
jgi:hypothetical protein